MTTYHEWLTYRARAVWRKGEPLPMDLFFEMTHAGLDVDKLQSEYEEQENDG